MSDKRNRYKFLVKFPTRERPEIFFNTLNKYYDLLSGNHDCHFLISCDSDDPTMAQDDVKERLNSYENLSYYFCPGVSKVEAINRDVEKHLDFDILILASDDMIPKVQGYDDEIAQQFDVSFPDLDGVTWYSDGYQRERINTLCILGKTYYDRFGYIYHPEYNSLWCDCEFTDVANRLGKQIYLETVIIQHEHPVWDKTTSWDKLYYRNEAFMKIDQEIYLRRKARDFNLS